MTDDVGNWNKNVVSITDMFLKDSAKVYGHKHD
jgi:hypothetical protein